MPDFVITTLTDTVVGADAGALVFILKDNVDDSCDRVRSIKGAGAVFKNLDPIYGRKGNRVKVHKCLKEALGKGMVLGGARRSKPGLSSLLDLGG
jgi:hypothetical protein